MKNVISKTEQAAGNGTEDPDGVYPQGLIEFDIACDTAAIRLFYHGIPVETVSGADVITVNADKIPLSSLKYRKYGPKPPDFVQSSWYDFPDVQFGKQMIGGKNILTASFTLKDGQLGDDTAKDGKIYDAGGLAVVFASLNVSKTGSGTVTSIPAGISCGTDCTENYVLNTQVTLTAASAEGYVFKSWGGACSGMGVCQVTMDRAKSVSAEFEEIPKIISGDIDNKGTVNLADAILALQVVAGLNPPNVNVGADLNSDNKIGLEEVIYILQKVAGLR